MYRTVVLVGYFRPDQPPILACGATRIRLFLVPGAEAFKRDNPNAEVHFNVVLLPFWNAFPG